MSTEALLWALGAVNLAGLPLVLYLRAPPLLAITAIVATHVGVINVLAGLASVADVIMRGLLGLLGARLVAVLVCAGCRLLLLTDAS